MALSIFIGLAYSPDEVYEQTNIYRLDGPMGGNGEPPSGDMPKNDVTGPMLIVVDAHATRNHLQILDSPIARIAPHLGDQFRRVRHDYMVSPAVPLAI